MARDILYRTDKAIFQHHGMDSMSQTVFPSISIKTMIIFVRKSQEKHLVKTPSSSQKLWKERKTQTLYKITLKKSLDVQRNKTSAKVIWKTKRKHPSWVRVLKIHWIVEKPLVPTPAGDFCLWRKVSGCWLQGYLLWAHGGFRGRLGLFDLVEDLRAKQKQERSVLSHRRGDLLRSLASAVDYRASLNPQSQCKENKQFPHIQRGASNFLRFHQ